MTATPEPGEGGCHPSSPQDQIPKTGKTQKINLEKLAGFSGPKDTIQNTTIATHFTTNSPRFHHRKTPKNRKTPSKNRPFLPEYFF
jgi:hypothetical protein